MKNISRFRYISSSMMKTVQIWRIQMGNLSWCRDDSMSFDESHNRYMIERVELSNDESNVSHNYRYVHGCTFRFSTSKIAVRWHVSKIWSWRDLGGDNMLIVSQQIPPQFVKHRRLRRIFQYIYMQKCTKIEKVRDENNTAISFYLLFSSMYCKLQVASPPGRRKHSWKEFVPSFLFLGNDRRGEPHQGGFGSQQGQEGTGALC